MKPSPLKPTETDLIIISADRNFISFTSFFTWYQLQDIQEFLSSLTEEDSGAYAEDLSQDLFETLYPGIQEPDQPRSAEGRAYSWAMSRVYRCLISSGVPRDPALPAVPSDPTLVEDSREEDPFVPAV